MLMITPNTDRPPATMVISIGNDSGFSDTGTGGTARGIACGGAGTAAACAGLVSLPGSVAAAGAPAPVLMAEVGSGQRITGAGADMLAAGGWLLSAVAVTGGAAGAWTGAAG